MKRARAEWAMVSATRGACDKEGNGGSDKSDGNKGGGQAMATRAMAIEKENSNQPATISTKAGGGW